MLEDDEIPKLPRGVPTTAHVIVDQSCDGLKMKEPLFANALLTEVFINKETKFLAKPSTNGHLKTPLGSLVECPRQEILERFQKNIFSPLCP